MRGEHVLGRLEEALRGGDGEDQLVVEQLLLFVERLQGGEAGEAVQAGEGGERVLAGEAEVAGHVLVIVLVMLLKK